MEPKRTCLIVNPDAGSADQVAALLEAVAGEPEISYRESTSPEEGEAALRAALAEGCACVAAAGGDGTVHAVVNGLMEAEDAEDVILGVVPLGTGNDLARTLDLPEDPRDAVALLLAGRTAALDLMEVRTEARTRFGINAAAGGFSGQVDEQVTTDLKKALGPLAYLLGAARVLPDLHNYETTVTCDDEPEERFHALNIIVANGRTAAGGNRVAPTANPCDGLLDVVIVKWGSPAELAGVGTRLVAGNYLDSPHVVHRRARRVRVDSTPGMLFNVDGEVFTREPVVFTARPGALRVVVGPHFQAEPEVE